MFEIIRFIFAVIVIAICYFLIRKSKLINKRRWFIITTVIVIMLATILYYIPIENAFVTFSSPESALRYFNKSKIKLVINGEKSTLVVGENRGVKTHEIIPRSNDGWKLDTRFNMKTVIKNYLDGNIIDVYQYKDSSDYYITVYNTKGGESQISDNRNSDFFSLHKTEDKIDKTYYTYYTYVKDIDDQYILTINGKEVSVTSGENAIYTKDWPYLF